MHYVTIGIGDYEYTISYKIKLFSIEIINIGRYRKGATGMIMGDTIDFTTIRTSTIKDIIKYWFLLARTRIKKKNCR